MIRTNLEFPRCCFYYWRVPRKNSVWMLGSRLLILQDLEKNSFVSTRSLFFYLPFRIFADTDLFHPLQQIPKGLTPSLC